MVNRFWTLQSRNNGSVEGIFRIVEDNSDELLTLNANPFPGMELRIDGPVLDSDVKDYFDQKEPEDLRRRKL